ncbi:hypothetical protein Hanom_Chr06g00554951 [Helianthus anomalus]
MYLSELLCRPSISNHTSVSSFSPSTNRAHFFPEKPDMTNLWKRISFTESKINFLLTFSLELELGLFLWHSSFFDGTHLRLYGSPSYRPPLDSTPFHQCRSCYNL